MSRYKLYPNVPRDRIDAAIEHLRTHGASHMVPIYEAVRDHGCANAAIPQGKQAFRFPNEKPVICIIGDDMDVALGPAGFHKASLRRFIKTCGAAVIVSSCSHLKPYAVAATHAVLLRRHVVLIETRPQFDDEWMAFVYSARPNIPMLLSTVKPAEGVH